MSVDASEHTKKENMDSNPRPAKKARGRARAASRVRRTRKTNTQKRGDAKKKNTSAVADDADTEQKQTDSVDDAPSSAQQTAMADDGDEDEASDASAVASDGAAASTKAARDNPFQITPLNSIVRSVRPGDDLASVAAAPDSNVRVVVAWRKRIELAGHLAAFDSCPSVVVNPKSLQCLYQHTDVCEGDDMEVVDVTAFKSPAVFVLDEVNAPMAVFEVKRGGMPQLSGKQFRSPQNLYVFWINKDEEFGSCGHVQVFVYAKTADDAELIADEFAGECALSWLPQLQKGARTLCAQVHCKSDDAAQKSYVIARTK